MPASVYYEKLRQSMRDLYDPKEKLATSLVWNLMHASVGEALLTERLVLFFSLHIPNVTKNNVIEHVELFLDDDEAFGRWFEACVAKEDKLQELEMERLGLNSAVKDYIYIGDDGLMRRCGQEQIFSDEVVRK